MSRTPFRPLLVAVLSLGLALVAACSPAPADATAPADPGGTERLATSLVALFEQTLEQEGLSDADREILRRAVDTGTIAPEDYDAAFARYASCMDQAGFPQTWERTRAGLNRITGPALPDEAAYDRYVDVSEECGGQHLAVVESLYSVQQGNPDLLADPAAVALQCLRGIGAVDEGYTVEDFARDFDGDLDLLPFDVRDGDVDDCLYGAGFAVAVA